MELKELSQWTDDYDVKVYESDAKGRANITGIFNYFQNSAFNHYNRVDSAASGLLPAGAIWLMTQMETHIERIPLWQEKIKLTTWSRGIDKLYAYRDYFISDAAGAVIIKGTVTWVVLDTIKRRILRLTGVAEKWPMQLEKSAIGKNAEKITAPVSPAAGPKFAVKYSDLDVNRHVNNVRYIEWMIDTFSMEFLESHEIKKVEINFIDEAMFGDEVSAGKQDMPDGTAVTCVTRAADGKEVARGRFTFAGIEEKQ